MQEAAVRARDEMETSQQGQEDVVPAVGDESYP